MPRGHVYSQRTNERLDDRMVVEGRERENDRVKSKFVAAEVARDVRHDVRTGNAGLQNLEDDRQSCCNTRRKTSPAQQSVLRHHVGVRACEHRRGRDSPRRPAGEKKVLLVAAATRMASKRWQRRDMRVLRTHGWTASKVMPGFFHQRVDATETISWLKPAMRCWIGWIEP